MNTLQAVVKHEYSYEDLVKIGAKHSEYYYEYDKYSGREELPILRDGNVVWDTKYTKEEFEHWEAMIAGMTHISTEFKDKQDVSAYVQPHPQAYSISTVNHIFTSTGSNNEVAILAKACNVWNIPRHFDISSMAALLYLLYTRHNRGDERATIELSYMLDKYTPIIANYVDMVAGGEVRHMVTSQYKYTKGEAPKDVENEAFDSGLVYIGKDGRLWLKHVDVKQSIVNTQINGQSRTVVWHNWYNVRQLCGTIALNWCIMSHMTSKRSGYGGVLWANCANLVRKLELGQISKMFFMDQALSLHHNSGNVFNKLWEVSYLQTVLNHAFQGHIEKLPMYLKGEDLETYNRVCITVSDVEVKQRDGVVSSTSRSFHSYEKSAVLALSPEMSVEIG